MFALALAAALAATDDTPADGKYALPGSGFTLAAPGWHMTRWSDWDFKGRSADGSVFVSAWGTSFQVPIDDVVARELANAWKSSLEETEHATDVVIGEVRVEMAGGQPRARATLEFTSGGGVKGVCHAAAFSTRGLTAQLYTITAAPMRERGQKQLDALLADLTVDKPPAPIGGTESLTTPAGSVELPAGWRAPLDTEGAEVAALFGRTGASDVEACTAAIRPHVGGVADLLLACPDSAPGTVLDDDSFADESTLFAGRLFGKGAAQLPAAEAVPREGEDLALLVHANDGLWVGGTPTATGYQVVWASGDASRDESLGDVARAALRGFVLKPESMPDRSFAVMLVHRLTYNPTHPTVLVPGLVLAAIAAFLVRMILRTSPKPGDADPHELV
jgi:hypothetical protein